MKKNLFAIPCLLCFVTFIGCAAPGSSITRVRIQGEICDQNDKPIAAKQVKLGLSKNYGLAGMDAIMGKPENYGHKDQDLTVETDNNGVFEHTFEPTTYSTSFWMIPPLGMRPQIPPQPYFFIRFYDIENEYYCIYQENEKITYRPISNVQTTDASKKKSKPFEISGVYIEEKFDNFKGWFVKFKLKWLPK